MLFLTRKVDETIMINDDISITVIQITGRTVKLGINHNRDKDRVDRLEVYNRRQAEKNTKEQGQTVHQVLQEVYTFADAEDDHLQGCVVNA